MLIPYQRDAEHGSAKVSASPREADMYARCWRTAPDRCMAAPELGFFRAVDLSHSPQTIHLERLALVLVCLADHQITRDPGVFRPLELSKITTLNPNAGL